MRDLIGVFANPNKQKARETLTCLIGYFGERKIPYAVVDNGSEHIDGASYMSLNDVCGRAKFMLSLGGDGTILKVAKACAFYDVPILAVNLGNIGFMTTVEGDDLIPALERALSDDYVIESRKLFTAKVGGKSFLFLNEIVVGRSRNLKIVPTDVYIDGEKYNRFYSDGVIVATPTGSTAYSMSANGPILSPALDGLIINGICTHSVFAKAVIAGADESIVLVPEKDGTDLVVDGEILSPVSGNQSVCVEKSKLSVKFIRFGKVNFYSRIKQKLLRWE